MAEALGAAATLISIIGFSAQVFDGCVKGFVLLSSANNIGRDADILRSMLDWELFRLEKWAEQAKLNDPAKADILLDWDLIKRTLEHLQNLTNDTDMLKKKYNLVLVDKPPAYERVVEENQKDGDKRSKVMNASLTPFKRLFGQNDDYSSTTAAKIFQKQSSHPRKLWWAAVDKNNMKNLINDIHAFVNQLHDCLNSSIQASMYRDIQSLLKNATSKSEGVPDLEYLRELATTLRRDPIAAGDPEAGLVEADIQQRFTNLFFTAIRNNELDEALTYLDDGVVDIQTQDRVGWPPLLKASEYGHLKMVEIFLDRGADPHEGTIGDRLPMHFAAEEGHLDVVKLLLQQPAIDPNKQDFSGRTAVANAVGNGHVLVLQALLAHPDIKPDIPNNDLYSPLLQAIYDDNLEIAQLLLARTDVDPNSRERKSDQTPLWMAAPGKVAEQMTKSLIAREDLDINKRSRFGETAFGRCARQSYNGIAQILIDANCDINQSNDMGQTPLSQAAAMGNDEGVELLLKQPGIEINVTDLDHQTALHRAAVNHRTKTMRLLLARSDVGIETKDKDGNTALSLAALNGSKICTKLLLKSKANINTQNKIGNTPLALAAIKGHEAVVRLLLESGADAEVGDEDEETPFDKARDQHLNDIVAVFKEVLKM